MIIINRLLPDYIYVYILSFQKQSKASVGTSVSQIYRSRGRCRVSVAHINAYEQHSYQYCSPKPRRVRQPSARAPKILKGLFRDRKYLK